MTIEELVVERELAQEMKEAGFPQEGSAFSWDTPEEAEAWKDLGKDKKG